MSQSTAAARVSYARPIPRPSSRERPAPPRLRVVAPSTHRSATGLALLCVALLGGGLLALLMLNISIGKGAYALTELQTQQRQLAENRQLLAEQVEAVSAPEQLAASARQLGMVPAPNAVFVRLPDGTVEGKPATAQAPPRPAPTATSKTKADSKTTSKSDSKQKTSSKTSSKPATPTGKQAPAEPKR
jgi:hypothetical protein